MRERTQVGSGAGRGAGRCTFEDGEGTVHQLGRRGAGDRDGEGEVDEVDGLPSAVVSAEPVVSTTHRPSGEVEPGPLDLEGINRLLGNVVLPQRTDSADSGDTAAVEEK